MGYRHAKRAIVRALGPLGGYRLVNAAMQRSPRIFMYHRFAAQPAPRMLATDVFESQLRVLAREFGTMTMGELVAHVGKYGEAPPYTAVVTVDDGHRDFLDLAVPLLQQYGVKATLFATTRFIEGDFWLWPDRLEYALFQSSERVLDLGGDLHWPLEDDPSRWHAWDAIVQRCTQLPDDEKESLLEHTIRALKVSLPEAPTEPYRAISVDELRQLTVKGIEIGAHTQTHPILSRLPEAALDTEIAGSKSRLEDWLQSEVISFCYPNGARGDYNDTVKQRVQAAGFTSAVAAYFRHDVLADLFEIKRLSAGDDMDQFRRNVYGVENLSSILQRRFGV